VQRLLRRRAVAQAALDACAWAAALGLATFLRYDFNLELVNVAGVATMIPLAMEAQFVSGYAFGLYRGRWRFGSFDEVASLAKAALLTTVLIVSLDLALVSNRSIPLSSAVAAGPLALVLMGLPSIAEATAGERL
jgi:FlaA1/EpsC-like NDP-sugar epimerase